MQRYKENMTAMLEKWESLHLQYANLQKLGIGDSEMRVAHQEVLGMSEHAEAEAETFYLVLKQRKKEQKAAEREQQQQEARAQREKKRQADQEAQRPIIKNFVTRCGVVWCSVVTHIL